jgi:hypothetical protein
MNWQTITMIVSLLLLTLASAVAGHLLGAADMRTAGVGGFTAVLGFLLGRWQLNGKGGSTTTALILVAALGVGIGSGGCAGGFGRIDTACAVKAASECFEKIERCRITEVTDDKAQEKPVTSPGGP